MSVLTQNERDGLEDVFSSIHSNNKNYKIIKELSFFIILIKRDFSITKFIKHAKYGIKQRKISQFLSFNTKKKKNLSK
jgi:hypothetical protein